jgi:hypothetical protein
MENQGIWNENQVSKARKHKMYSRKEVSTFCKTIS